VSIALIIPTALITNYLVGWDYHSEYHAYNLACKTKSWNPTFNCLDDRITKGYSSLSVTILPVIYSTILDIDGTWIFKILYPIVLSFIPLALYKLYYEKLGDKAAFLAIFFLLSNSVFFNVEIFSAKQIIGEFFYVLLFLVILKEKIGNLEKSFFFIVFSAALVMSHYSLAYIFLFCIFLTWFSTVMIKHTNLKAVKSRISLNMVILFFSIAFTWYIYTSASTLFNSILEIGDSISRNFITDFFNPSARTSTVLKGLGLAEAVSIWHQIGRTFFYISEFFIVIGMLRVIIKKEYGHFGYEYAILSFTNLTLLFMAIVIPNFAKYFRMERFYQISLLFLAPFFVLGGKSVFEIISKWRKRTKVLNLILLILIPFFLFETGFFYEVIGDYNYSLPLSMYRMNRIDLYRRIVDEKEVISSFWLLRNVNYSNSLVYSDSISSGHVLTSYAMLSAENMRELSNSVQFLGNKNYVYLREVNTIEEKIEGTENWYNFSDVAKTLLYQNLLYSNGDCEIFLITND
jgi:uncharacterized membrane protein